MFVRWDSQKDIGPISKFNRKPSVWRYFYLDRQSERFCAAFIKTSLRIAHIWLCRVYPYEARIMMSWSSYICVKRQLVGVFVSHSNIDWKKILIYSLNRSLVDHALKKYRKSFSQIQLILYEDLCKMYALSLFYFLRFYKNVPWKMTCCHFWP